MLEVRDCTLYRGETCLFQHLSFEVKPGEVLTLMGPSGRGKSTLLNWLIGDLPPVFRATGGVWLHGQKLDALATEQRHIGILFQDDLLFPHFSVGQNLALALPASVRGRKARQQQAEAQLAQAGLDGFYHRDPATLSGGQRARVSLLRALLAEPQALLLDEPFSRLDSQLRSQFRDFVYQQVQHNPIPVLLVTHDRQDVPQNGRVINL